MQLTICHPVLLACLLATSIDALVIPRSDRSETGKSVQSVHKVTIDPLTDKESHVVKNLVQRLCPAVDLKEPIRITRENLFDRTHPIATATNPPFPTYVNGYDANKGIIIVYAHERNIDNGFKWGEIVAEGYSRNGGTRGSLKCVVFYDASEEAMQDYKEQLRRKQLAGKETPETTNPREWKVTAIPDTLKQTRAFVDAASLPSFPAFSGLQVTYMRTLHDHNWYYLGLEFGHVDTKRSRASA